MRSYYRDMKCSFPSRPDLQILYPAGMRAFGRRELVEPLPYSVFTSQCALASSQGLVSGTIRQYGGAEDSGSRWGSCDPPSSMNGCPQPTDPARTIPLHMGHRWLLPLGSGLAGRTLILPHAHTVDYFSRIIWPCPQNYNQVNFLLESYLLTTSLGKDVIFNTDMLFKEVKVAWLYLLQHRPEEVELVT